MDDHLNTTQEPPEPLKCDWLLQLLTILGSFDPPVRSSFKDRSGIWESPGWTAVWKVNRSHPSVQSRTWSSPVHTQIVSRWSARVSDLRKQHLVPDYSKPRHWYLGSERSCVCWGGTANNEMSLYTFQAGAGISYSRYLVATVIFESADDGW